MQVDAEELARVQGICVGETEPLRREIQAIRDKVEDQTAGVKAQPHQLAALQDQLRQLRVDQLEFQQRQELQLQQLLTQIPTTDAVASLTRDVGTIRHDHNSLMERDARVNEDHSAQVAIDERDARIRELESQLAAGHTEPAHRNVSQRNVSHRIVEPVEGEVPTAQVNRHADRGTAYRDPYPRSPDSDFSSDDDQAYYGEQFRNAPPDPTKKIRSSTGVVESNSSIILPWASSLTMPPISPALI